MEQDDVIPVQRFDFTLNDQYYIMNIKLDKKGERIQTFSSLQGRVVAKEGIMTLEEQEVGELTIGSVAQKIARNKYYFQYRIDELADGQVNPKICIGVCREDFLLNQDLSRQINVWCINCATGDKFTSRRWRDYYDLDTEGPNKFPLYGEFEVGTIVGVLIDIERGTIHFYKDGNDLGQAFIQQEIKEGCLYPFVQLQVECKLSIFHPFVYPHYRAPETIDYEQEAPQPVYEEEYQQRDTMRYSEKPVSALKASKETERPQAPSMIESVKNFLGMGPEAAEEKKQEQSTRKSFKNKTVSFDLTPDEQESVDDEELKRRMEQEKNSILSEMSLAQLQHESQRKSIKVNNKEINLDDLDLQKLQKEQAKEMKDIEDLQKAIENMSQNLTAGDVRVIDDQFSLNMTKPGTTPPIKGRKNQANHLNNLQYEIDKYQK